MKLRLERDCHEDRGFAFRTITNARKVPLMREVGQTMDVEVKVLAESGEIYTTPSGSRVTVREEEAWVEISQDRKYLDLGPFYNEVDKRLQLREQQE